MAVAFLASDDASYVFVRESEEEKLVVAFQNGSSRDLKISLRDAPAQGAAGVSVLFGEGQAELVGQEIRLQLPAQSLSIFALH